LKILLVRGIPASGFTVWMVLFNDIVESFDFRFLFQVCGSSGSIAGDDE